MNAYIPYLGLTIFGILLFIGIRFSNRYLNMYSIPIYCTREYIISISATSTIIGVLLMLMQSGKQLTLDWTFYLSFGILISGVSSKLYSIISTENLIKTRYPYSDYAVINEKLKLLSFYNIVWIIYIVLETISLFIICYFKFETMLTGIMLTGLVLLLNCLLLYDSNRRINKAVDIYNTPSEEIK